MIRYCPNAEFDNASEVVGEPNRYFSSGEMAEFLNEIQSMAKIPLFIAVDQEGSTRNDVNRAGALAYSGHMSFGAANDEELTYKIAKAVYEANNNVIVVAMDSPYDVELVPYIDNFVATYGVAAASMYAAVDVIAGRKEGKAKSDKDGKAVINGYYGDYDVTVTANGKTATQMVSFHKGYDNVLEITVK